eukprot:TRINITY_DN2495_c0_g2_i1.p2 TRINITY_DN2495_c0_g2~~TRINITY_DN2495_c0_g2_i1.p2  ORF type:complete len:114 (-),score=20.98 TRINITY_DN2495_c0_g2_i1:297-638(-)
MRARTTILSFAFVPLQNSDGKMAPVTSKPIRAEPAGSSPTSTKWTPQSEEIWKEDAHKAVCGESGESEEWEEEEIVEVVGIHDSPVCGERGESGEWEEEEIREVVERLTTAPW